MGVLAKDPNPPRRASRPGTRCSISELINKLDDDDTAVVLEWINDRGQYPAGAITSKLIEHGFDVGKSAVERHRRRDCCCRIDSPHVYG